MHTIQTDLEQLISTVKKQKPPAFDFTPNMNSRVSKTKQPEPSKPEPAGTDPFTGNSAFGAAAVDRKAEVELMTHPYVFRTIYLEKPFLIWQSGDGPNDPDSNLGQFLDYRIQPYSSWARMYLYTEGGSFHTHLSFYYLWTNEASDPAAIRVDAPIQVTGSAFVRGNAGVFSGYTTEVSAHAWLQPMRWIGWGINPTSGLSRDQTYFSENQKSQADSIVYLSAKGGGLFGSAREASQDFNNQQFNLYATSLLVPAGASILFRLWLTFNGATTGNTLSDQAWIDFGRQGNHLLSPYMRLSVITPT